MRNLRVNLIFFLILLFSLAITGRLIYLQILKGDFYKALSQGLHSSFNETLGERGEIFLKDGTPLAINLNFPLVFASPKKIRDFEKTSQILSEILNLDSNPPTTQQGKTTYDFILEKLKKDKDKFYSLIKKKLSPEEVEKLKNLSLEGIFIDEERGRYYPQENLASQTVGFLGAEGKGQYGLEESFDNVLISENGFGKSEKGTDLILTIDYSIQFEAEKLLERAKGDLEIEKGEIIVIDPNSGKIIALANFPNFNPNQYEDYAEEGNLEIFKNGVTQELFEPGSVFKPITMAAALNEEKITPQTIYRDPGEIKIDGWTIYNYDGRKYPGEITMTEVLEKSINTGAVFAQRQIPNLVFLEYIKNFGFFEPTGIDLRESYSQNQEINQGREINFATASYGQGINITPIQLARAYCAIANGGKLITPYLVEEPVEVKPQPEEVISQKTASQLTAMLVSVVENGFGNRAKIPGYYIAGKTGTALQPKIGEGVYSDKTWQTFVGYFPAFNPKFLILIKLDNPKTKTAEYSAVPIFHDLAEYIINYWKIPPDYE